MPANSLVHMATACAIANVKQIDDFGDCSYNLARPILLKIQNPDQLRKIEETSPLIIGADGEIWRSFLERDIPGYKNKPVTPKDPNGWSKLYEKLTRKAEAADEASRQSLKAALSATKQAKDDQQIKLMDNVVDPNRRRKRAMAWNRSTGGLGKPGTASTGNSILDKVRKETLMNVKMRDKNTRPFSAGRAASSGSQALSRPRAPGATTAIRAPMRPIPTASASARSAGSFPARGVGETSTAPLQSTKSSSSFSSGKTPTSSMSSRTDAARREKTTADSSFSRAVGDISMQTPPRYAASSNKRERQASGTISDSKKPRR